MQGKYDFCFKGRDVDLICLLMLGIHKFLQEGIVRVGGRSNSEILKRFNLRELTHSHNFRRTLPSHLRTAYNQVSSSACYSATP